MVTAIEKAKVDYLTDKIIELQDEINSQTKEIEDLTEANQTYLNEITRMEKEVEDLNYALMMESGY